MQRSGSGARRLLSRALLVLAGCLTASVPAAAHPSLESRRAEIDARIAAHPGDADGHLLRAAAHRSEGLLEAALADLARASALEPARRDVALLRALVLLDAGRPEEAELALAALARSAPGDPAVRLGHARALAALGRHDEAARSYDAAIASSERASPELYLERMRSLARAHAPDPDPALRSAADATRRLGPVVALEAYAVELEVGAGRIEAALARLERLASLGARDEHWWLRRGEILAGAGRTREAREALERALAGLSARPPARRATPAARAVETRARGLLARIDGGDG